MFPPQTQNWSSRPGQLTNQNFGMAFAEEDVLTAIPVPPPVYSDEYYRPWRHVSASNRDIGSSIKQDKDRFQLDLDVQHFAPEEISVKTVNNFIVVEAKHQEKKDDHGFISRHFLRRYELPEGMHPEMVVSKLSSDGVLTVFVPKKVPVVVEGERIVPIAQTGPVRREVREVREVKELKEKPNEDTEDEEDN